MTTIPDTLEALRVPVASLKPYGRNPRRGDVAKIVESLKRADESRAGTDTDPIAPPPEPTSKAGDLYRLGEHLLLCGDARSADDMTRLLEAAGGPCDAMWTDPPYGVNYVGGTADRMTIKNDTPEGLEDLLTAAFAAATDVLKPGAAVYVAHPAGSLMLTFGSCFVGAGWRLHQTLVWVKNRMVLGHADYHYRHEPILQGNTDSGRDHDPILYGYTPGEGRRGRGGEGWYGDNSQTSVLKFDRPKVSREHPTAKPVPLVEHCLRNSSAPGHAVLDPFAGGGATLIAADNLNRRARLVELDPAYVDVIVDRWERHTGGVAERVTP